MTERTFDDEKQMYEELDQFEQVERRSQQIDEAFAWARDEMERCNAPVQGLVHFNYHGDYVESPFGTVALFYDRQNKKLLLRRHWRTGELRYDEIVNALQLCFESKPFVDVLVDKGIQIANQYQETGDYAFNAYTV